MQFDLFVCSSGMTLSTIAKKTRIISCIITNTPLTMQYLSPPKTQRRRMQKQMRRMQMRALNALMMRINVQVRQV